MSRFLVDANLPYRFSLWHGENYQHVFDLGDDMPDAAIWEYAKQHELTIVSKDADFSDWIMLDNPPPRVIHLRIGNMRMRDLFQFLQRVWPQLIELSASHKLIIVNETMIECIALHDLHLPTHPLPLRIRGNHSPSPTGICWLHLARRIRSCPAATRLHDA